MTQTTTYRRPIHSLLDAELLSVIPCEERQKLAEQCTWHRLRPGQLLIDGDLEAPHGVFLLTEGTVELARRDTRAGYVPLGRLSAPACLGEFAAITDSPGTTSVRTVTTCELAELTTETFVALLSEYPAIAQSLLRKAVSIVRALDDDIVRFHVADNLLAVAHRKAILRAL